ncbi:MAG: TolC family protein [Vampirovibrionales bacterium]|nr:TolC family protein [Vampirovibrionales bacterium]
MSGSRPAFARHTRAIGRQQRLSGLLALAFSLTLVCSLCAPSQALSLDEAIQKAIEASFDLKIAATDVSISRQDVLRTQLNEYLPAATFRVNTEYARDLTGSAMPSVRSVGDTISVNNTLYQNSMALQLSYNVLDFGVRRHKVRYLKQDVQAKAAAARAELGALKEKVVRLYTEALLADTDRRVQQLVASSQQEVTILKQRLYQAGLISRAEVADEAVQLAQSLADAQAQTDRYEQALSRLSQVTHETYSGKGTALEPLQARAQVDDFQSVDFTNTAQTREVDHQIAQKREELKVLNRQLLPAITAYGNYRLYGSDPQRVLSTYRQTEPFAASVGMATSIALFDAGRQVAGRKKIHLELEKLSLQREKVIDEQRNRWLSTVKAEEAAQRAAQQAEVVLRERESKLGLLNRLADERMLDQTLLIKAKIKTLADRRERDKAAIERLSALETLRILAEGAP